MQEHPVFIGIPGHPSFGDWHSNSSCKHVPRPNGQPVLRQSCALHVVLGLSVGTSSSQAEAGLD